MRGDLASSERNSKKIGPEAYEDTTFNFRYFVRITRCVQDFITVEATIAAFRHPKLDSVQAALIQKFDEKHVDTKYSTAGIVLHAPFTL
jgi:hypothetical protein